MQERHSFIANALVLRFSCTNPSRWSTWDTTLAITVSIDRLQHHQQLRYWLGSLMRFYFKPTLAFTDFESLFFDYLTVFKMTHDVPCKTKKLFIFKLKIHYNTPGMKYDHTSEVMTWIWYIANLSLLNGQLRTFCGSLRNKGLGHVGRKEGEWL